MLFFLFNFVLLLWLMMMMMMFSLNCLEYIPVSLLVLFLLLRRGEKKTFSKADESNVSTF